MSKSINFIDLFDWEKESDRHYMEVLMHSKEEDFDWNDSVKEQTKKPAEIVVVKPILNKKKNDIESNTSSF
jgi:hypothetical protein